MIIQKSSPDFFQQHGINWVIYTQLVFESSVSPQPACRFCQVEFWQKTAEDIKCRFTLYHDQESGIKQVLYQTKWVVFIFNTLPVKFLLSYLFVPSKYGLLLDLFNKSDNEVSFGDHINPEKIIKPNPIVIIFLIWFTGIRLSGHVKENRYIQH